MQGFPFDSQLTFDSDNLPVYDRAISSQPLRKLIRDLFTTGVMPNPSTNLQVSSGTDGMTVQVQAGFAVVDGGLCQETETRTLEITAADTTYDRIDTVVLRWNENVDARTADLYVVAGTPSATPVRPTLQRDNSIYEIGLADVFITKRVATITDDKITDTRYEAERCGIVSSVSEWDTTTIYQQVQADLAGFKSTEQAEFMAWFDYMKDQLSEDAAGHLQEEVDELKEVEYTSSDTELEPTTSETVALLTSGETAPSRWAKVSQMFKNIRYLFKQVDELNNDLTDVSIGSQIGNGTSNFTVSSSKRRLLCITKKNDVIIESKEIPMSVLNANDVIPLGNQAPIIGVAPKKNLSGITTQTSLVGKEIANYVSSGGYPALFYDSNDQTNYQNIQKSIGLATDLGNALGAKITYNGNDAFTINVADSSLSVYVY